MDTSVESKSGNQTQPSHETFESSHEDPSQKLIVQENQELTNISKPRGFFTLRRDYVPKQEIKDTDSDFDLLGELINTVPLDEPEISTHPLTPNLVPEPQNVDTVQLSERLNAQVSKVAEIVLPDGMSQRQIDVIKSILNPNNRANITLENLVKILNEENILRTEKPEDLLKNKKDPAVESNAQIFSQKIQYIYKFVGDNYQEFIGNGKVDSNLRAIVTTLTKDKPEAFAEVLKFLNPRQTQFTKDLEFIDAAIDLIDKYKLNKVYGKDYLEIANYFGKYYNDNKFALRGEDLISKPMDASKLKGIDYLVTKQSSIFSRLAKK